MLNYMRDRINDTFGSRRGLINLAATQLMYGLGGYRQFQSIEWSRVERLIFVCHGNICRSPLGEYVAKAAGLSAESFGLSCGDGFPADPRAIRYGKSCNLDLTLHRSRNIATYSPQRSDLIVVMEPAHLSKTKTHVGQHPQITLSGLWLNSPRSYIHDPFSTNDKFFASCEYLVSTSAQRISARVAGRFGC